MIELPIERDRLETVAIELFNSAMLQSAISNVITTIYNTTSGHSVGGGGGGGGATSGDAIPPLSNWEKLSHEKRNIYRLRAIALISESIDHG